MERQHVVLFCILFWVQDLTCGYPGPIKEDIGDVKYEKRLPNGTIVGKYLYLDNDGNPVHVKYFADDAGYGVELKTMKVELPNDVMTPAKVDKTIGITRNGSENIAYKTSQNEIEHFNFNQFEDNLKDFGLRDNLHDDTINPKLTTKSEYDFYVEKELNFPPKQDKINNGPLKRNNRNVYEKWMRY